MESPRPGCEAMEVRAAMAPQDNLEGMSFPRLKALAAARGVERAHDLAPLVARNRADGEARREGGGVQHEQRGGGAPLFRRGLRAPGAARLLAACCWLPAAG